MHERLRRLLYKPDERRIEVCRVRILNGLRDPRPNLIEVVAALDELTAIARRGRVRG